MSGRGNLARAGVIALAALALAAPALLTSSCNSGVTPGGAASGTPAFLRPDAGWVSAGGATFGAEPPSATAGRRAGGSTLIAATGSEARVKWVAAGAVTPGTRDARSRLTVRVTDVTDPAARSDVVFRGASGAGSAVLPIEAGKRTVYRVSWKAVGTYRRCAVLIEERTL